MHRRVMSTGDCLRVLLGLLCAVIHVQTQCTEFINIGNEKRSLKYALNVTANERSLCDSFINPSKWYSFEERTGSEIPELDTLEFDVCGAGSPIFIFARSGESYHSEAKRTKVATTAPVRSADGGFQPNILILFCENRSIELGKDAYVYQLEPTGCPLAYCAGDKPACPFGMIWNGIPGVERCVQGLPLITSATLRGPLIARSATVFGVTVRQFAFYCDIDYPIQAEDDGARFKITIYLDNSVTDIKIDHATGLNPSAEIVETVFIGNLGKTVQCGVRAFWFGNENPVYSKELKSNSYWIGIKSTVDPVVVNYISGDKTARITFQSTVPITCWHCYLNPIKQCRPPTCTYTFRIASKPDDSGMGTQPCEMYIDETTDEGELTVHVTSVFPTPIAYYKLHFSPMMHHADYDPYVLWKNYVVKNTTVEFRQSQLQLKCESTGDPHIKTIGNIAINNYKEGVFNLASSLRNASGVHLQIQVRQVPCGTVSCNCAIIIREFNEAHMIDACYRISPVIVTILQPIGGSRATIWQTSNQITVSFPSGLKAVVNVANNGNNYLNIYLTIPGFYTGFLDGLCTETQSQTETSRVTEDDPNNMFERQPNCSYLAWEDFVCGCEGDNSISQCTGGSFRYEVPVVPKNTGAVCDTNRRSRSLSWAPMVVRSVADSDDYIDPSEIYSTIPYDPNFGSNVNPVWPTASGITEQQATDYCLNTIKSSSAYTSCAGKFVEVPLVANCKLDVQLLDNLEGGETYRDTMESHCLDTIIVDSKVTTIREMRTNPLVVAVTTNMCPNACSSKGTCSNGVCTCSSGFAGSDCGINANSSAVIRSLYQNGLCDTQSRACANTNVEVANVYDAGSLTCRFKRYHLTNTSIQLPSVDVKGTLNTLNEVRCPTPSDDVSADNGKRQLYGYKLSVSSDGAQFSNEMILNVYDSACLTCQPGSTTCQLTSNTCFINAQCQSSGIRRNASVDCLTCLPQTNMAAWTDTATWSAWSACSRVCDSGITKRKRACATPPSPDLATETEFCQTTKCPGQPDERTRGVILSTSMDDVKVILSDEQVFFGEIVKAVNSYCGSHSADCCTALGLTPSAQSGGQMNVTTDQQCSYAASFPDVWSTPARHKVIVKAYTSTVHAQCTGTSSLLAEIYFDSNLILQAVTNAKSTIENALGVALIAITAP